MSARTRSQARRPPGCGLTSRFQRAAASFSVVVDALGSIHEYWAAHLDGGKAAAVSWMWAVLVGVTPSIIALCRDLVSLCRHAIRRASIGRIVRDHTDVIRIVDRTAEGDVLEIEIRPSAERVPGLDLRSAGS